MTYGSVNSCKPGFPNTLRGQGCYRIEGTGPGWEARQEAGEWQVAGLKWQVAGLKWQDKDPPCHIFRVSQEARNPDSYEKCPDL